MWNIKQIKTNETQALWDKGLRGVFAPEREEVTGEWGKFCNEDFCDFVATYYWDIKIKEGDVKCVQSFGRRA
jgi:hypothetical protein